LPESFLVGLGSGFWGEHMARSKSSSAIKEVCRLKISATEAQEKLSSRVLKGGEIKARAISSESDLENSWDEYYKWDEYNTQLLKTIFSTEEFSEEYNQSSGFVFSITETTFWEKISDLQRSFDRKFRRLDSLIERLEIIPQLENKTSEKPSNHKDNSKIFIVHGHDELAKTQVARFIEKLGLKPIILHEQASSSQTIIEKIESYTDVGFGVVLYTPCDKGAKESETDSLKNRARQNVVFEHGFLIGKLGRNNVCPIVKGTVETPNDISGIVYTPMDGIEWQISLARELRKAGYNIDMNLAFS